MPHPPSPSSPTQQTPTSPIPTTAYYPDIFHTIHTCSLSFFSCLLAPYIFIFCIYLTLVLYFISLLYYFIICYFTILPYDTYIPSLLSQTLHQLSFNLGPWEHVYRLLFPLQQLYNLPWAHFQLFYHPYLPFISYIWFATIKEHKPEKKKARGRRGPNGFLF